MIDNENVVRSAHEAGIPNKNAVHQNVTTLMDDSVTDMNATTSIMDKGSFGATREGNKLKDTVNEKQDIYSAGSAPSVHETMDKLKKKLTNTFKDAFD